MREGVGYMMLLGQCPKVTVDIVGVAGNSFELKGHVFEPKSVAMWF